VAGVFFFRNPVVERRRGASAAVMLPSRKDACTGIMWVAVQTRPSPVSYQASGQEEWRRRMGTLVGAKKARRTERQLISGLPGGSAQVWLVMALTPVVVAIGIWVAAMILL
jgi:hypothetical protein